MPSAGPRRPEHDVPERALLDQDGGPWPDS